MAGLWFEDLKVGMQFDHALTRTITETDNVLFSTMTHNPAKLHLDEHWCRENLEHGQRLVNSCFTLALMVGISVGDTTLGTAIANLGWDEVRLPNPVYEGDTIYAESEVLELRASGSRPEVGIVTIKTIGYNQDGTIVVSFKRTLMVYRQGQGPGGKYRPEPKRG